MRRMQISGTILLSVGSLGLWWSAVTPVAGEQQENKSSGSEVSQQDRQEPIGAVPVKEIKVMREYRGIKIGMKRAAVRDALGKPENSDKGQDSFKIGGDDRLTAHYDNDNVKVIQLYFSESKQAPKWIDVVGDTEVVQRPDGSKVARADVFQENFWISMYQSSSGSLTTITISRSSN
jgi:hypothetical protein